MSMKIALRGYSLGRTHGLLHCQQPWSAQLPTSAIFSMKIALAPPVKLRRADAFTSTVLLSPALKLLRHTARVANYHHQTIKKEENVAPCFFQHKDACFSLYRSSSVSCMTSISLQIVFSKGSIPHCVLVGI